MKNGTEQRQAAQQEQKESLKSISLTLIEDRHPALFADSIRFAGPKNGLSISVRYFREYNSETEEYIESEVPDIILLDLSLGGRYSGDEICKILREKGYSGKIALFTGAPVNTSLARQWGADAVIYLDVDPSEIVKDIKNLL